MDKSLSNFNMFEFKRAYMYILKYNIFGCFRKIIVLKIFKKCIIYIFLQAGLIVGP